jgi:hypothetical protein
MPRLQSLFHHRFSLTALAGNCQSASECSKNSWWPYWLAKRGAGYAGSLDGRAAASYLIELADATVTPDRNSVL